MGNDAIIIGLSSQLEELFAMIQACSKVFIHQPHKPDKWSIHQNLAHLGRYQEIYEIRMTEILNNDLPNFQRYVAEKDEAFMVWERRDTDEVLRAISLKRKELTNWYLNLTPDQLNRSGSHPKLGMLNIKEWTQFFLLHEKHHIYAIFCMIHEYKNK